MTRYKATITAIFEVEFDDDDFYSLESLALDKATDVLPDRVLGIEVGRIEVVTDE